jgi:hypothetical protein
VRFLILLGFGVSLSFVSTAAELPVTRVVLYKHGVGFFERSGNVAAGESVQLQFKQSEMNDVLKSLTIDSRGGVVASVRYDSSEPLEKKLEAFPFRVGDAQPLSRLLDQFKGARLRLRLAGGDIEGTIISSRTIAATEQQAERDELVLLMDNAEIRNVDPLAASGVQFVDTKIQQQFRDYLQFVANARNLDKRNLTIDASGQNAGQVSARYIIPAPVWKSSYRLVFDSQAQPMLEGWSIVDNTTGEDWTNVRLSLVSGMPVSFISPLYEPDYVERQVATLPNDRAQRPIIHAGGIEFEGAEESAQIAGGVYPAAPPPPPAEAPGRMANRAFAKSAVMESREALSDMAVRAEAARVDVASSLGSTATATELGELFEYAIQQPVTVKQGESAMLPFLQQRIGGRKLALFNEAYGSQHPLNAVEMKNESGKTLDGGAITIFDAGAYAGEALVETVKANDKRLISYGVDLGTRITTAFDSSSKMLSEFTLRRGLLTTRSAVKEVRTYTIRNVDAKEKTIVIERPARDGYKVVTPEPVEKTAKTLRYEVKAGPAATVKFPVEEERVLTNSVYITNLTYDHIVQYARNKELDAAARAKLEPIADLKRQIAGLDNEVNQLEQDIQRVFEDQNRIRQNISTLRSVNGQQDQVQEYAQKLATQESELVTMRDRQADRRQQKTGLERKLNDLIETLVI